MTTSAPTDGGKAKIPKLKHKVGDEDATASTNGKKSTALARCFFPAKPQEHKLQAGVRYSKACKGVGKIMREQILEQLRRTKPYKARGPDGILYLT